MTTVVGLVLLSLTPLVTGHGYIIDPPGRSSMWRVGFNTPINYNDNQLFCGGAYNENFLNKGKCGVCGDPWQGPRDNEAGGRYATGTIGKYYRSGQSITVSVVVTANHMGWFEFKLCPSNNWRRQITHECLDSHVLERSDGRGSKYYISSATGTFEVEVRLPPGLTCSQCVLQWRWHTGNSWGVDASTGRGCLGCGPQEEFYGCADIAISNDGNPIQTERPPQPTTTEKPPPFITQRPYQPVTQRPYQLPTTRQPPQFITLKPFQPVKTEAPPQLTTRAPFFTQRPVQTEAPQKRCFGVNNWAGVPSLDHWCLLSCASGNCPQIYCRCV